MASPFALFRKHQKTWMAIACLAAIVAFVLLPNVGLLQRGGGGRQDLVVVKTKKYGNLLQSGMSTLRQDKQKVRAVLVELRQTATGGDPTRAKNLFDGMFGPATDDGLVETWLKMQRAHEIGMVISDESVTRFLEMWTAKRVPLDTIKSAITRAALSDAQFYDLLREELLAQQITLTFQTSIAIGGEPIATPSQRWDWFNRINRKAVIEAVALDVADYVGKIEKPADDVLKEFFKKYKDNLPDPRSPDPGFKRPQRVAMEYFKADVAKFAAKVTDAEILKEYEENKDDYDRSYKIPPPEQPAKQKAAKKASEIKPKPQPTATKNAPNAKPAAVEPKKEPKTAGQTPKKDQNPPAAEMKQTTPKAAPKSEPKAPNKPRDSKGALSAPNRSPFLLAAMQQQTEKTADKPSKSPTASKTSVKSAPPTKAESPAAKPEKPAAKEKKPAATKAAPKMTTEDLVAELPDAMKKDIRHRIALQKILKEFADLRKPVEEYQQGLRRYDLQKIQYKRTKKELPPPPAGPNLQKLAKEDGLSFDHTELLSVWDARKPGIGSSLVRGSLPVWAYVFKASKYRSDISLDGDAVYLFWKSEDEKASVPKFDDKGVYEEVLHSWKMVQARSLAKKATTSLADEANKAGKRLVEVVANRPDLRVVLPPKFSWMTESQVALTSQQPPRIDISTVTGVPMAGEDFMRTVFRLQPGQAGVAFNAPQTKVYVVRPSEFTPSYEVRWLAFLADSFTTYASAGMPDVRQVMEAWREEIKKSAGFEWGPGHKAEQADEGTQQPQPVDDD